MTTAAPIENRLLSLPTPPAASVPSVVIGEWSPLWALHYAALWRSWGVEVPGNQTQTIGGRAAFGATDK